MNEPIFELIQSQNGFRGLLWTEEDKQEFAELIVRECWENVSDEQLINEARKRGYIIKDAAITMTRDDILRMAQEASDGLLSYDAEGRWILSEQEVIRLAALVAAAEREECVELCLEHSKLNVDDASAHELGKQAGAAICATAIRARGEA